MNNPNPKKVDVLQLKQMQTCQNGNLLESAVVALTYLQPVGPLVTDGGGGGGWGAHSIGNQQDVATGEETLQ